MPTSNINDEMRQAAEYAIRMAKERFGQDLEYSEDSLSKLEILIEQAHQQFNTNKVEGKISNETALNRTASIWGSYLGELIRGKLGGTWIIEESKRWMVVNDFKFSPIDYIYQRITGQLQGNVKQYFDEVAKRLSSQPINLVQPQNISNNKNKSSSVERILQIVLGVAVLFLIFGVVYLFVFPKLQNYSFVQPTITPALYLGYAWDYVPSLSDMPQGFEIVPNSIERTSLTNDSHTENIGTAYTIIYKNKKAASAENQILTILYAVSVFDDSNYSQMVYNANIINNADNQMVDKRIDAGVYSCKIYDAKTNLFYCDQMLLSRNVYLEVMTYAVLGQDTQPEMLAMWTLYYRNLMLKKLE